MSRVLLFHGRIGLVGPEQGFTERVGYPRETQLRMNKDKDDDILCDGISRARVYFHQMKPGKTNRESLPNREVAMGSSSRKQI